MQILCVSCTKADLQNAKVQLRGTLRQEDYTVEMEGLLCPNCGYVTVDSKLMPEFGRLMADKYRRAHGLLTSADIVALRTKFGENQQEFAARVGVGVASIKRWELGKIQDERNNELILDKTRPPLEEIGQYKYAATETTFGGTSLILIELNTTADFCGSSNFVGYVVDAGSHAKVADDPTAITANTTTATATYIGSVYGETTRQSDFSLVPAATTAEYRVPIPTRGSHAY